MYGLYLTFYHNAGEAARQNVCTFSDSLGEKSMYGIYVEMECLHLCIRFFGGIMGNSQGFKPNEMHFNAGITC